MSDTSNLVPGVDFDLLPWEQPSDFQSNDDSDSESDSPEPASAPPPVQNVSESDSVERAVELLNDEPGAEPQDATVEDQGSDAVAADSADAEPVGPVTSNPTSWPKEVQAQWTKKTQSLAEQRRATEQQALEYASAIQMIAEADPSKMSAARAEIERVQQDLRTVHQTQFKLQQAQAVQSFAEEHGLDAGTLPGELQRMDKAAKSLGFTSEELAQTADPRILNAFKQLARLHGDGDLSDETIQSKIKPQGTRTGRPRARSRHGRGHKSGQRQYEADRALLRRTGDPNVAARAAAHLLGLDEG